MMSNKATPAAEQLDACARGDLTAEVDADGHGEEVQAISKQILVEAIIRPSPIVKDFNYRTGFMKGASKWRLCNLAGVSRATVRGWRKCGVNRILGS